MYFVVLDSNENRKADCLAFNAERKGYAGHPDELSFETYDKHITKYDRVLYRDVHSEWHEYIVSSVEELHAEDGITYSIYAENSLAELRGYFIEDKRAINATPQAALSKLLEDTRWTANADNLGLQTINFYRCNAWEGLDEILKVWQAEIKTEIKVVGAKIFARNLYLKKEIAEDLGKRFAWGKDVISIKRTIEDDDIITALYGFGKSTESEGGGHGRKLDFASVNGGKRYVEDHDSRKRFGMLDRAGNRTHRFSSVEFSNETDPQKLLQRTKEKLKELALPHVTYEANVVDLATYGFQSEGVKEGSIVLVKDQDLGLSLQARVMELTEDLDNENEKKLVIGNYKRLLGKDTIWTPSPDLQRLLDKESMHDRAQYINETGTNITYVDQVLEAVNKQLNTGTSYISFDENRGLVVLDAKDESKAKWCVELNSKGLRFANKRLANGEWDFTTVATGDGFIAENMFAGKLTADIIHMESMTLSEKVSEIEKEIDNIEVTAGKDGKSAYEIAKEKGFDGTEEEWLASLKGEGVSVVNTVIEFAIGTEEKPNEAWFESPPATWDAATDYIWQRTKTTYSDGSSETSGVNRLTSTEVKKIFENLHGEIAALEDKLGKSIESLLDEDGVISPLEYADLANTRTQIENEYQVINAKVATGEVKDNLYNKYKALYEILGAIPSAGSSYTAVDSEGLRKAYQEYTEAKAAAEMEIAQAESKRFTDMEAGQISLGSRINAYEEQLRLESGLIAMYLNKGNGLEEAMRLTNEELAFLLNGNKEVWIGLNGLNSERGTFTQLSFGNHKATKQGTDYTVISWIGG